MKYCFDTSVLINPWTKYYRPRSFPTYWKLLEKAIVDGSVLAPMEVLKEIEKQDDDLKAWAIQNHQMFREVDERVEEALKNRVLQIPGLVNPERERDGADPWVIAQSIAEGALTVTDELEKKRRKTTIPAACEQLGLKWIRVADFIEQQGWQF